MSPGAQAEIRGIRSKILASAYQMADLVTLLTKEASREAFAFCGEHLNGEAMASIKAKTFDALSGVAMPDGDNRESIWQDRLARPHSPVKAIYGSRLNATKRWKIVMHVYRDFLDSGGRLMIRVTSPGKIRGLMPEIRSICPRAEVYADGLERHQFHSDVCAWGDVMISASAHEGYTGVVGEAIMHGVLVFLPRMRWAVGMMGPDYPLYYNGETEVLAALHLFEEKGIAAFRGAFDAGFDRIISQQGKQEAVIPRLLDVVEGMHANSYVSDGQEVVFENALNAMPDVFNFNDWYQFVFDERQMNTVGRLGVLGRIAGWHWLKRKECTDVKDFRPILRKRRT